MATTLIQSVAAAMEKIAPLALADASWDNVGILLENPQPHRTHRLFLTIDLTPAVLEEALRKQAEVIVAYHPPIFAPMKRLVRSDPKQEIVLQCAANGISIYSPHTALDAAVGGMNDWLLEIVAGGSDALLKREPIQPTLPQSETGMGRVATLVAPVSLPVVIDRIKKELNLPTLRVAVPSSWGDVAADRVRRVAVCAGSGSSVFRKLRGGDPVDVVVTGEMSHHDVLAANDKGQAVILCEHTNSERGYLKVLEERLAELCPFIPRSDISRSTVDKDPLVTFV